MLFVTGEGGGEKAVERIRAVKEGKEMEEIKDGGDTRCYFFFMIHELLFIGRQHLVPTGPFLSFTDLFHEMSPSWSSQHLSDCE